MDMNFRILSSGIAVPVGSTPEATPADGTPADDADNLNPEVTIPCLHPNRSNLHTAFGHDSQHGTSGAAA